MSQMQSVISTATLEDLIEAGNGLVTSPYNYISFTYVPSGNGVGEIQTATFKSGGSGGTTVATLTFTYNSDNKLTSIAA